MASIKKPSDLADDARVTVTKAPLRSTEDTSVDQSGSAQSAPTLPRFDSVQTMTGSARPAVLDEPDKSAVPQTVDQATDTNKVHVSGRKYRTK